MTQGQWGLTRGIRDTQVKDFVALGSDAMSIQKLTLNGPISDAFMLVPSLVGLVERYIRE